MILVLCAVLVMVAIVMNAMLKDFQQAKHIPDNPINPVMSVDPYASTMPPVAPEGQGIPVDNDPVVLTPEPVVTPSPTPVVHSYEVVKADVSWTQAQQSAHANVLIKSRLLHQMPPPTDRMSACDEMIRQLMQTCSLQ